MTCSRRLAAGLRLCARAAALPGASAPVTVSRDLGAVGAAAADHDPAAARAAVTRLAGATPPLAAAQAALDGRLGLPAS